MALSVSFFGFLLDGRTFGEQLWNEIKSACSAYLADQNLKKTPGYRTTIKDHNQFTRDFLDDNPNLGLSDVRRVWAEKIKRPSDSGCQVYHRDDLNLLKSNGTR